MAIGRLFASSFGSIFGRVAAGAWIPAAILSAGIACALALAEPSFIDPRATGDGFGGLKEAMIYASVKDWAILLVATLVIAFSSQFAMVGLVRIASMRWSKRAVANRQARAKAAHLAHARAGDPLEHDARLKEQELRNFPLSTSIVTTGSLLGNVIEKAELDAGSDFGVDYGIHAPVLQALARRAGSDPTDGPRLEVETLVSSGFAFVASAAIIVLLDRSTDALLLAAGGCALAYCAYRLSVVSARRYVLAARTLVVLHIRDLLALWGEPQLARSEWRSTFAILNTMEQLGSSPLPDG